MPTEAPSALERRLVGAFVRTAFLRGRRGGPWPVPEDLAPEAFTLLGNTGARLAARWFPAQEPRGAVLLAHPDKRYAQHWFVREGWVPWLVGAGFSCLTFDFPGYGQSRGGSTYFPEDVLAAAREAGRRAPGLPLHAIGLSLGAFHVANASPRLEVEGMVLESPYPNFNAWYGDRRGARAMKAFDALFPRTSAMIQADRHLPRARARRILVASPGDDRVTPAPLARAVARAAPQERTTWLELPGLGHLEPFRASARYREAVLEALGLDEDEAFALARPAGSPRPPAPLPISPPARLRAHAVPLPR